MDMDRIDAYKQVGSDLFWLICILLVIVLVGGCVLSTFDVIRYGDDCQEHGYDEVAGWRHDRPITCVKTIYMPLEELQEGAGTTEGIGQ